MLKENEVSILYERHSGELLRYIYSFVRSGEAAEDILHDSFERLIRYSRDHHVEMTTARPFLFKICRNCSIDHVNRTKKMAISDIADHAGISSGEDIEEETEKRDLLDRVHGLIDRRDPMTRSIFYLKAEMNKTYEEIAMDLGISERTAKRKMSALLDYLADELENAGYVKIFSILLA